MESVKSRVVNTTEFFFPITGLFPGVNYSFTVTAYNMIGPSLPSVPLIVRTLEEGKETCRELRKNNSICKILYILQFHLRHLAMCPFMMFPQLLLLSAGRSWRPGTKMD